MNIREATTDDIPAMVDMGRRFHAQSVYADWAAFDPESVIRTMLDLIADVDSFVLVAEEDGRLVGAIGVFYTAPYFNRNARYPAELFWWVNDEARGGAGMALLRTALERVGPGPASLMDLASSPPHVRQIYAKLGFEAVETAYLRRA